MSQTVIAATIEQLVRNRIHDITDLARTISGQSEYLVNVTVNGPQDTVEAVVFARARVDQRRVALGDADALGRLEATVEWLRDYAKEGQPS